MHKRPARATALAASTFLLAGFIAFSSSAASAAPGDETGEWFTADARLGRDVASPTPPGTTQSRTVALDADTAVRAVVSTESLALAQPGERLIVPKAGDLALTLFDGERVSIEVTEVAVSLDVEGTDAMPTVEVIGHRWVDGAAAETAAFTFIPDESGRYALYGGIDRGVEPRVEIDQSSSGVVRLNELGHAAHDPSETDGVLSAPGSVPAPDPGEQTSRNRATATPATIDLLVGYVNSLGAATKAAVTQRVTETNTALVTSGVNIRVNLMSMAPVAYTQSSVGLSDDAQKLKKGDNGLDILHNQRDAVGADLIALIVPKSIGAWGWGFLPAAQGTPTLGVSVTAADRLDGFTLAHELGHNFGSDHDYAHSGKENIPFAFSYGHQVAGKARDIMSYDCPNVDCAQKAQYANPNVKFIGHPTIPSGTATADAARSFNLMAPVIANYRTKTTITRLSGGDRYETAATISRHGFSDPAKVATLVVATGTDFPDALSAAPLAAKLGGPLLLTHPSGLPAATTNEIKRLKPSKILVIGGTTAVPSAVESALKGLVVSGGSVQRISGDDRYTTSVAIGKYGWSASTTAFIATGLDYPDALSAGAAAGKLRAPVVLVPGTSAAVPATTSAYLTGIGTKTAYIAGGTTVVSSAIETALKSKHSVVRYAGSDRFNTSNLIAKAHHTKGGSVYLASGLNFPDALAGAVIAGRQEAPLALSPQACVLRTLNDVQRTIAAKEVVLLGGASLLSDAVGQGIIC
ncbi:cell wall-binding repeat-containing protein [Leifsonia sp. PS1209]|uniref:cell wall-binding repeat-containing protein n=1 Tax=Leifsonia sp. PS1209 TaxID=2724914 RepID=UPI001442CECB|nr:cell wall-binding repeat-containing protein [Leifsonia sp. PS1209]QIZ97332.1 hypothetical protein HF024_01460 [Leifsonia sp. PS1209]